MKAYQFFLRLLTVIINITIGYEHLTEILADMAWFLEPSQIYINLNIKPFRRPKGNYNTAILSPRIQYVILAFFKLTLSNFYV